MARGLFDPIVEFMRPIPPLALIPLVILWFGIDETAKIFLLFLAALFIMTLAARAGRRERERSPRCTRPTSLGASTRPGADATSILPNALPEIFTGLRTAMGVCWGTVVAAELVAADRGLGSMIMIAKNFLQTDTVVIGIVHDRPHRLRDRAADALGRAAAGAVAREGVIFRVIGPRVPGDYHPSGKAGKTGAGKQLESGWKPACHFFTAG